MWKTGGNWKNYETIPGILMNKVLLLLIKNLVLLPVFSCNESPLHHKCVISVLVNIVDVDMSGAILSHKMGKYELNCQYHLNKTQEKTKWVS